MTLGRGLNVAVVSGYGGSIAMSRSHGRIQLQVLDFLYRSDEVARVRGDQVDFVGLIEIAGKGASRSRVESVRRATKSLAAEGLVLLRYPYRSHAESPRGASVVNRAYDVTARLTTSTDWR